MKRLVFVLVFLFGLFVVRPVMANEGIFHLRPVDSNGSGACFVTSIYMDGAYRILMTCRDLKMALDPVQNKYVAWVEAGSTKRRIGEVINGKLQGRYDSKFDRMSLSLESDATASKMLGPVVLAGVVEPIDFGRGIANTNLQPSVTVTTTPTVKPTVAKTGSTSTSSGGVGTFLGAVVKVALLGFGLLILVVGIFGFVARRKSL